MTMLKCETREETVMEMQNEKMVASNYHSRRVCVILSECRMTETLITATTHLRTVRCYPPWLSTDSLSAIRLSLSIPFLFGRCLAPGVPVASKVLVASKSMATTGPSCAWQRQESSCERAFFPLGEAEVEASGRRQRWRKNDR